MSVLTNLLAVARTFAVTFVPGVKSIEETGEALLGLIRAVRPTLDSSDQAALDAALPALLAKMNRDVDAAIADLTENQQGS